MRSLRLAGAFAGLLALAALTGAPAQAQKARAGASGGQATADAIASQVLDNLWLVTDMHWHKGEYSRIVNLSRIVVAGQPGRMDAYANAGWLLWSMDRDPEAIALYEQGARANPHSYYLYDELGFLYTHRKNWPAAVASYEKAAQQKDCPAQSLHMLAHAYEKAGRLDKALTVWNRAASDRRNPAQGAAIQNRNRVRRLIEQSKGAAR